MESSIPSQTLVKLVDAEDNRNEKIRTLHHWKLLMVQQKWNLKNYLLKSMMQTLKSCSHKSQRNDPNNRSKSQTRKYCKNYQKSNYTVSNRSRKQQE